ncbi:MAG: efflux RND transporter periplasmic adaptor subunit [Alcaligenes sp.]|nr:efflux RND transporter periplasmic adaptor subunit [Alcaligenes sp.]
MARFRYLSPALSLFTALVLMGCSQQAKESDPRTQAPLVIQSVIQPKADQQRRFLGLISARVESPLAFRVGGKIDTRKVQNGEHVEKGQLLMTLDPKDLQLDHRARLAAVQAATAQAEQAQSDYQRFSLLVEQGGVSRQAHEQSKQALRSAQANLKSAQAQAEIAHNADQYSALKAEASGIITAQLGDVGQVVSAGQAVLRLAQDGPRDVIVSLPEQWDIPLGTHATIELTDSQESVPAQLRELAQSSDPATRSYQARFSFEDENVTARLGSSAIVHLTPPDANALNQIPLTAIYDAGKGPGVWVIDDQKTVHWQAVTIAKLAQEHAYLSEGPEAGTSIVGLGANLLHEGQEVRPETREAKP